MFSGFGPIIMAIIYLIISLTNDGLALNGTEVFTAVLSTYVLAFIHAGASVFNQIEQWPIAKSLLFHFGSLYLAYTGCYLLNSWIEFNLVAWLIFTGIFVVIYFVVWTIVVIAVKSTSKKINARLE